MENPRRARVVEQHFLNLPGFDAGAYVRAYVEDTSEKEVGPPTGKRKHAIVPDPLLVLEISDCYRRIDLEFDISESGGAPQQLPQDRHVDRGARGVPLRARRRGGALPAPSARVPPR